jgi:hypothetical protein
MRTIDEKLHVSWSARLLGTRSPTSISRMRAGRRSAARPLTLDEARRIAAKRPEPAARFAAVKRGVTRLLRYTHEVRAIASG